MVGAPTRVYPSLGTRVVAAAINLSDSPRFARTLPRAFDAEGVPKAPLPLIQDGVAHRVVHDRASAARAGGSAASTDHALAAGGSPFGPAPTNLVLIGGGAADEHKLATPIDTDSILRILGAVEALGARQRLVTEGEFLRNHAQGPAGRVLPPALPSRRTRRSGRTLPSTRCQTALPIRCIPYKFAFRPACTSTPTSASPR